LCRNCSLQHVTEGKIEGRIEVMQDKEDNVHSHWMTYGKDRILEIERGSTRLHCVEYFL